MINMKTAGILAINFVMFPCVAMEDCPSLLAKRSVSEWDQPKDSSPIAFKTEEEIREELEKLMRCKKIQPLPFHSPEEAILSVNASLRKKKEQAQSALKKGPGTLKKASSAQELLELIKAKQTYFEVCDQSDSKETDDKGGSKIKKTTSLDSASFNGKRCNLSVISEEKSEKIEKQGGNVQWLKISSLTLGDKVSNSDSDSDNDGVFEMEDV